MSAICIFMHYFIFNLLIFVYFRPSKLDFSSYFYTLIKRLLPIFLVHKPSKENTVLSTTEQYESSLNQLNNTKSLHAKILLASP